MKACGVIAEYNPFHLGHHHQLAVIRQTLAPDVIIVLMSGNFVQRGEPALLDKWLRAQIALSSGADLVIESPIQVATQATDYFAAGNIEILSRVGCYAFSFGSEHARISDFLYAADWIRHHQAAIDRQFRSNYQANLSYAANYSRILNQLQAPSRVERLLVAANSQLGLAYVKANQQLAYPMQPHLVNRLGMGHRSGQLVKGELPSGKALRRLLLAGGLSWDDLSPWLPVAYEPFFSNQAVFPALVTWEDLFQRLRQELYLKSTAELAKIYQMQEGIEHRLKRLNQRLAVDLSFAQWVDGVKTKRWTRTRLQRLLLAIALGLTEADMRLDLAKEDCLCVRVLGATSKGLAYLNHHRHAERVRFATTAKQAEPLYDLTNRSDRVYTTLRPGKIKEQVYQQRLLIFR